MQVYAQSVDVDIHNMYCVPSRKRCEAKLPKLELPTASSQEGSDGGRQGEGEGLGGREQGGGEVLVERGDCEECGGFCDGQRGGQECRRMHLSAICVGFHHVVRCTVTC